MTDVYSEPDMVSIRSGIRKNTSTNNEELEEICKHALVVVLSCSTMASWCLLQVERPLLGSKVSGPGGSIVVLVVASRYSAGYSTQAPGHGGHVVLPCGPNNRG